MKRMFLSCILAALLSYALTAQTIIDHNCMRVDIIPSQYVTYVINNVKWHYAHTSHGSQLTTGLEELEILNSAFAVDIGWCALPNSPGEFCIHDGQRYDDYVTPEMYWQTTSGMNETRAVLNGNTALNYSGWAWCCQCDHYTSDSVQTYLDSMNRLEQQYSGVTFIYMTGNAQATGDDGYNRHLRNNQIRQYCQNNGKILFDFADMDCWWFNDTTSAWEQHTYYHNGQYIPAEHPAYYGDYNGSHTAYENCLHKGMAVWYMFAVLSGWATGVEETPERNSFIDGLKVYPNPFTSSVDISFSISKSDWVEIYISDVSGRKILNLLRGDLEEGAYSVSWHGVDFSGRALPPGIYIYKITQGSELAVSGVLKKF
ncbi:T9SS type A sorting domain-containing protein [candidate division WOR-3 bacterium]|nr:T9SS type A sorting domain-containing protein [candidate division WOR-3 bacterium]